MSFARIRRIGRVLPDAAPHLLRAMRWPAIPAAVTAAGIFLNRTNAPPELDVMVVSLCLAGGLSFVVADPAAPTLASSPVALADRLGLRLALTLPVAVASWVLLLAIGSGRPGSTALTGDAWLFFATAVTFALAIEQAASRSSGTGGLVAVPALLAAQLVTLRLPPRFAVYPIADHRGRWLLLLVIAVVAFAVSLRDPALGHRRGGSPSCATVRGR